MIRNIYAAFAAVTVASAGAASAAPTVAVWLDGRIDDATGGGNTILTSLTHSFGPGYYQLVSTADLETPGFLDSFSSVIVSRYDHSFGTGLSALAAANVKAYVGVGPAQGGVALFTNDAADDFYGADSDPYVPDLDRLFTNSVTFAVASGHGYIGEYNGAEMAVDTNGDGFAALGLLQGDASSNGGVSGSFIYDVGPIGANNPIDNGVSFPLNDTESSTFLTKITNADPNNIVDIYSQNAALQGLPAILANKFVITGGQPSGTVPEPATWAMMVGGFGLVGGAMRRRQRVDLHMA